MTHLWHIPLAMAQRTYHGTGRSRAERAGRRADLSLESADQESSHLPPLWSLAVRRIPCAFPLRRGHEVKRSPPSTRLT